MPTLVQRIEEALAENMSVVIGLTSTGEASAMRAAGLKPAAALAALGLREDAPEAAEAEGDFLGPDDEWEDMFDDISDEADQMSGDAHEQYERFKSSELNFRRHVNRSRMTGLKGQFRNRHQVPTKQRRMSTKRKSRRMGRQHSQGRQC